MEVIIRPNADAVGATAAARVAHIAAKIGPEVVLGLSTGSSPLAT